MKHFATFLALLLCACSAQDNPNIQIRNTVAGQSFCVPKDRIIEAAPWVPYADTLKSEGFAVSGCYWEQHSKRPTSCKDLKLIGSFGVVSETTHAFTNFGSLPEDAFYRSIVDEPDTVVTRLPDSDRAALSNERLSWLTLYWKLSSSRPAEHLALNSHDVLLFTCQEKMGIHHCNRIFNSDGLSISYDFITDDPGSFSAASQDADVLSFLQGLKCNAV